MRRGVAVAIGGAAAAVAAVGVGLHLRQSRSPDAVLAAEWPLLHRYCSDCHNDLDYTADISFDGLAPRDVDSHAKTFEAAIHKLRLGVMPPRDRPQPDAADRAKLVAALEAKLDAAAEKHPYAGAIPVHRLNRAEYANAVRDLLGLDVDVASLLPSDGGDFGFDNIAAVLRTSPLLLERYLTAALRVSALAVGDPEAQPSVASYKIPVELTQNEHMPGLPLGTRGGTLVHHVFPADADYVFSGRLMLTVAEGYAGIEGHDRPFEFVITLDGKQIFTTKIGGPEDHAESVDNINTARADIDKRMTSPPIHVTAGPHEVGFTWVDRPAAEQNVIQPSLRATLEAHNPSGLPRLQSANVEGPYDVTGVSDNPVRARIFLCHPKSPAEEPACARRIFLALARHAFRRPVKDADIAAPLAFYERARGEGGNFDAGIRDGLARILVSPSFLFRAERDPEDLRAGATHRISDLELASRLSFFLWSSIPDDALLEAAAAGKLHEPDVLEAQVRRMLADEKSAALVENFTGQWLQLRNLEERVKPDVLMFPDFDENLRRAFRRETELLFANVLRQDHSVLELLTADYTFVNERLARHYGIPGVYGVRFRKVQLTDPNRYGLLGQGSLLALTSNGNRTSPVIRGKFVISNFLDDPPPLPPPVVPALEASKLKDVPMTVRQTLERHRKNPVCASCHKNIDPVGFALENFDAVGKWRDKTRDGLAIDSAGTLADGTPVNGPVQLRAALLRKPDVFAGTVTKKLMIYALGRGLEPADMPVVRAILADTAHDGYRLQSIILDIVKSYPFQMRTKPGHPADGETVAQTRE
ncbi:MAG TPA: DUF1592 domain-containing protein [Gammaproteobacteria bacterium]|nr:DUF1592 domain-containing protein [Gammaproteobacteria bacterium]